MANAVSANAYITTLRKIVKGRDGVKFQYRELQMVSKAPHLTCPALGDMIRGVVKGHGVKAITVAGHTPCVVESPWHCIYTKTLDTIRAHAVHALEHDGYRFAGYVQLPKRRIGRSGECVMMYLPDEKKV